jgi:hypothetical protein
MSLVSVININNLNLERVSIHKQGKDIWKYPQSITREKQYQQVNIENLVSNILPNRGGIAIEDLRILDPRSFEITLVLEEREKKVPKGEQRDHMEISWNIQDNFTVPTFPNRGGSIWSCYFLFPLDINILELDFCYNIITVPIHLKNIFRKIIVYYDWLGSNHQILINSDLVVKVISSKSSVIEFLSTPLSSEEYQLYKELIN